MITAIGAWGDAQDRELARTMPTRDILACVDENFHAAMMLVAMEPVSAERDLETARAACEAVCADRQAWAQTRHGPGRPPDFDKREAVAAQAVKDAVIALETAQKHRAELRAAVRDLGDRYHPIDLATGTLQTTESVEERLLEGFERVWDCVVSAGLGDHRARVCNAIAKAQRVVPSLVSMVAWWHRTVSERLAALSLTTQERAWVMGSLLPLMYLDREAARGADKDARARLRAQRDRLHATLEAAGSPWVSWSSEQRAAVRSVVQGCVDLFVRASSCVEGRNGQLSLHHHRTHRLPNDLLRALTVIHNDALTRRDGTTAAERFSGRKHADLFKHLIAIAPMPARPRVRPRTERRPPVAA